MIRSLSSEELALRWSEIKPFIDKAIDHGIGEVSSMDMFVGAMNGQYECLEAIDDTDNSLSFGMLRINTFNRQKQLQIVTTAGDSLDVWAKEGLEYVEDYAKVLGCKYVTIWGRLGWPRVLKKFGYKQVYAVCAKEIEVSK